MNQLCRTAVQRSACSQRTVVCAKKCVNRVDLTLSVLTIKQIKAGGGDTRKWLEVTDMSVTLTVVMVLQVYACVQAIELYSFNICCLLVYFIKYPAINVLKQQQQHLCAGSASPFNTAVCYGL